MLRADPFAVIWRLASRSRVKQSSLSACSPQFSLCKSTNTERRLVRCAWQGIARTPVSFSLTRPHPLPVCHVSGTLQVCISTRDHHVQHKGLSDLPHGRGLRVCECIVTGGRSPKTATSMTPGPARLQHVLYITCFLANGRFMKRAFYVMSLLDAPLLDALTMSSSLA